MWNIHPKKNIFYSTRMMPTSQNINSLQHRRGSILVFTLKTFTLMNISTLLKKYKRPRFTFGNVRCNSML